MTNTVAPTSVAISTVQDVPETFVEQHLATIAHLQAFVLAVQNYKPGMPGANAALQEAVRPLRLPSTVNMTNALDWAIRAIAAEEAALALEQQKEAALATLKAAERLRREAEKQALRARRAWVALTAPAKATQPVVQAVLRKSRASSAPLANAAELNLAA